MERTNIIFVEDVVLTFRALSPTHLFIIPGLFSHYNNRSISWANSLVSSTGTINLHAIGDIYRLETLSSPLHTLKIIIERKDHGYQNWISFFLWRCGKSEEVVQLLAHRRRATCERGFVNGETCVVFERWVMEDNLIECSIQQNDIVKVQNHLFCFLAKFFNYGSILNISSFLYFSHQSIFRRKTCQLPCRAQKGD